MSKGSKSINNDNKGGKGKTQNKTQAFQRRHHSDRKDSTKYDYLFSISHAPTLEAPTHWFQMLPALFFTGIVTMITRMATYDRPMEQFFFWSGNNSLTDFFSYYKMIAILICAVIAIVILLYRIFIQSFCIKRSIAYIPMIVYSVFVLLSYLYSDYKQFALWGWNDRFEGTLVLLSYMIMLFYMINSINTEKNVKWIIYLLAGVSTILGLIGISQATNHDFFRTAIGKKAITPSWFWDRIDSLNFTFQDQIYQTVYNINYVSFYLTLLIPVFGMLFIRSIMLKKDEPVYKKVIWGGLFALLIYNLIGSASSSGLMGMAFVVLIALIVLNKNIINWWQPVCVLLIITVILAGLSFERWAPELSGAINSVLGRQENKVAEMTYHKLDYMETTGDAITLGYEGEHLIFTTYPDDPSSLSVHNSDGKPLTLIPAEVNPPVFQLEEKQFNWIKVKPAKDDDGNRYVVIITDGQSWPFRLTEDGPKYLTGMKKLVDLYKVPALGWKGNQSFGSGRGYIWSRTIPMMKETLILGHGADTYCIYFPHNDYVGKYNAKSFSSNIDVIVDKPHNLYMGYTIGTGVISVLALLFLWISYIIQSFRIYRKKQYSDFLSYAGSGIFLGICGFLVAAMVNDSSVSVTPMFYGLLATGISINMMLKNTSKNEID